MPRPQISDDHAQVVKEIHRQETQSSASSLEEALETVVQLADQNLRDRGWYPGKYAGKAFERVLGDNDGENKQQKDSQGDVSSGFHQPKIDPQRQAVFKQILDEDYSIELPNAERQALGLTAGEVLQVIAYPADSDKSPSIGQEKDC